MRALLLTGKTEACLAFVPELAGQVAEWRACLDEVTLPEVLAWNPDVIVSYGYRRIVTPDVLAVPRLGAWNLHPSLLPIGRGAHPVFWALAEGQPVGVSVHEMNAGLDTGWVLAQTTVEPKDGDTVRSLYDHTHGLLRAMWWSWWPRVVDGRARSYARPQGGPSSYHRAADLERYWPKLPDGWDTPVEVVQGLGLEHGSAHV